MASKNKQIRQKQSNENIEPNFWSNLIVDPYFGIIVSIFIILTSVLLRSSGDFGTDSAIYLDISKRIVNGGRFYHDFLEINSPINFYIYAIPALVSKLTGLHISITGNIFVNLIGILSVIFSARILRKSTVYEDKALYNFLIIIFTFGYFIRAFTITHNEYSTKTSLFLGLILPYISFSLPRIGNQIFSKKEKIFLGIITGLIPCIKPNYVLIPAIIEIGKLLQKRKLSYLFRSENFIAIGVIILYAIFLFTVTPEYFQYILPISWDGYAYSGQDFNKTTSRIFLIFYRCVFFVLTFIIISMVRLPKSEVNRILFLAFIGSTLIFISELLSTDDQASAFWGVAIIIVGKLCFDIFRYKLINKENKKLNFALILILILSVFSNKVVATEMILVPLSWFIWSIIAFWLILKDYRESEIRFTPTKIHCILYLLLASATSFVIVRFKDMILVYFFVIFSAIIIKEIYAKYAKPNFNYFSKFGISLIALLFMNIVVATFVNSAISAYEGFDYFRSPNILSNEFHKNINHHAPEKRIVIISTWNIHTYPLINYANIDTSEYSTSSFALLFQLKTDVLSKKVEYEKMSNIQRFLLDKLINDMKTKKTKLIFLNKLTSTIQKESNCDIGFIEFYSNMDPEFKKAFTQNYKFLNRIVVKLPAEEKRFLINKEQSGDPYLRIKPTETYLYDFDIYITR